MSKKIKPLALLLLVSIGIVPLARAQDTGAIDMTGMGIYAGEEAVKEAAREPGKASAPAAARSFTYTPTAALRQQTIRSLTQQLRTSSPATTGLLQAHYSNGQADYQPLYDKLLANTPYRNNDAASALALYLEAGYRIVHQLPNDAAVPPTQQRGLLAQVRGVLGRNTSLARPGAAASVGEQFKLQAVLLVLGWQQARQNGQADAFRNSTAALFKNTLRLDLAQLTLTTQGLRHR